VIPRTLVGSSPLASSSRTRDGAAAGGTAPRRTRSTRVPT
jgi:hypothetical protein